MIRVQYFTETGKDWYNEDGSATWHYRNWLEKKLAELQNRTCETCKHKDICTAYVQIGYDTYPKLTFCSAHENRDK